jgi:hypothetical protein
MPKSFNAIGFWRKCLYEIKDKGGVPTIVSISRSLVSEYNPLEIAPLEVQPETAADHFENSPHMALLHLDTKNEDDIIKFVNRWGLLGLRFIEKYSRADDLPSAHQDIIPNSTPSSRVNRDRFQVPVYSSWYEDRTKKTPYKRQEPLPMFVKAVLDYQLICNTLLKGNDFVCVMELNYFLEGVSPANYWIEEDEANSGREKVKGRWQAGWRFRSLLEALYLQFSLHLNAGGIRQCKKKGCFNYFVQSQFDPDYCSKACKWNENNKNSQIKKKKEQIYIEFPSIDRIAIEQTIDKLINQNENDIRNWRKYIVQDSNHAKRGNSGGSEDNDEQ